MQVYDLIMCDTLMMMMMMMMMNYFCGIVDRQNSLSFTSSRDHSQRFSLSQISDTPSAVFEPAQNLSNLPNLSNEVVQ